MLYIKTVVFIMYQKILTVHFRLITKIIHKLTSGGLPDGSSVGTGARGDVGLVTGLSGAAGITGGVTTGAGVDGRLATMCGGRGPALRLGGAARGLSEPRFPAAPGPPLPRTAPSGSMSASSTIIL